MLTIAMTKFSHGAWIGGAADPDLRRRLRRRASTTTTRSLRQLSLDDYSPRCR